MDKSFIGGGFLIMLLLFVMNASMSVGWTGSPTTTGFASGDEEDISAVLDPQSVTFQEIGPTGQNMPLPFLNPATITVIADTLLFRQLVPEWLEFLRLVLSGLSFVFTVLFFRDFAAPIATVVGVMIEAVKAIGGMVGALVGGIARFF